MCDDELELHWFSVAGYDTKDDYKKKKVKKEIESESNKDNDDKLPTIKTSKDENHLHYIYRDMTDIMKKPPLKSYHHLQPRNQRQTTLLLSKTSTDFMTERTITGDLNYHDISLIDRISSVVSSISSDAIICEPLNRVSENEMIKRLIKICPDISDKLSPKTILRFFVNDYYLNLPFNEKFIEHKKLYEASILKDPAMMRVLKRGKDVLPREYISIIDDHNRALKMIGKATMQHDSIYDADLFFYTSLSKNFRNFINELGSELQEISYFQQIYLNYLLLNIEPINIDDLDIKKTIVKINIDLKKNKDNPVSLVRFEMMKLIAASNYSVTLSNYLAINCMGWLNSLIKNLFSNMKSIREETCIVLAFMFHETSLLNELMKNRNYDIAYDIALACIKASEQYESNVVSYFFLLGVILDLTHSFEVLELLLDKGPTFKNAHMSKCWPLLVLFSLKHWSKKLITNKAFILRKIIEIMQDKIYRNDNKRPAKLTLVYTCRTFQIKSPLTTVWYKNSIQ